MNGMTKAIRATLVTLSIALASAAGAAEAPLRVCATTPDVGSLVREIGGDRVSVTVFGKGTEDPHYVQALPSYVKAMSDCALYVQNGFELELGWAPVLLQQARNPDILAGSHGYLDLGASVSQPLQIPNGPVDRSMGDLHPLGNPHYLLDPLRGLAATAAIRDKLTELAPDGASGFAQRFEAFKRQVHERLVGSALATTYGDDVEKLARLFEAGRLGSFLESQSQKSLLGGWLGAMLPHFGAKAVDDHRIWVYFARRFGIEIIADLEPLPGVPPTTRRMQEVIGQMKSEDVKIVLASAYYDPRYANFVARETGAKVLRMANQVEAVPEAGSYLAMVDYNVRQVSGALGS